MSQHTWRCELVSAGYEGGKGMGTSMQSIVRERINITEVFSLQVMFSESWLVVTPRPEMPVLNKSVFYDPPLDGAILCADRIWRMYTGLAYVYSGRTGQFLLRLLNNTFVGIGSTAKMVQVQWKWKVAVTSELKLSFQQMPRLWGALGWPVSSLWCKQGGAEMV